MESKCLNCGKTISNKHNQKVCLGCRKDYYKKSKLNSAKKWYKENKDKKQKYDNQLRIKKKNIELKTLKPKICIICGRKINPSDENFNQFKNKITCSPECANKHKNNLTGKSLKSEYNDFKERGICVGCGLRKLIHISYGSNIYCKDCHKLHLERTREYARVKENRFEIENCIVCGVDITDRPSKSKYCKKCADAIRELYHSQGIRSKEAVVLLRGKLI